MPDPVTIIQKILRIATLQAVEFTTFSGHARAPPIETGGLFWDIISPLLLNFETCHMKCRHRHLPAPPPPPPLAAIGGAVL